MCDVAGFFSQYASDSLGNKRVIYNDFKKAFDQICRHIAYC